MLICYWRGIETLINPQVIFCFPWKVKYFATLKSAVTAKADYLNEISLQVVYGMLLKLLEVCVRVPDGNFLECFLEGACFLLTR